MLIEHDEICRRKPITPMGLRLLAYSACTIHEILIHFFIYNIHETNRKS
jgi:hypothetical protein